MNLKTCGILCRKEITRDETSFRESDENSKNSTGVSVEHEEDSSVEEVEEPEAERLARLQKQQQQEVEDKRARQEKKKRESQQKEREFDLKVCTWLVYIRNSGQFNMFLQFGDAFTYALLCGQYCGQITGGEIRQHYAVDDGVGQTRVRQLYFGDFFKLYAEKVEEAKVLPYSHLFEKKAKEFHGDELDNEVPLDKLLIEKAKERALNKAKFARDVSKIRQCQTTDEHQLLWFGMQFLD